VKPITGMQDLLSNPKAYGLPTFDEYCKDPDTYKQSYKRLLTEAELGPDAYRGQTREIWYWVGLNKFKTTDRAHQCMQDMGWAGKDVAMRVDTDKGTAGKLIFNVRFFEQKPQEITEDEQVSRVEK
jgi:hypothetical protein